MFTRMFSSGRIIPLDTQPLTLCPLYLAMVANSAKLAIKRQSFADVEWRVGGHVFRWQESSAGCVLICLNYTTNSQAMNSKSTMS
jgi:hypothetical protein